MQLTTKVCACQAWWGDPYQTENDVEGWPTQLPWMPIQGQSQAYEKHRFLRQAWNPQDAECQQGIRATSSKLKVIGYPTTRTSKQLGNHEPKKLFQGRVSIDKLPSVTEHAQDKYITSQQIVEETTSKTTPPQNSICRFTNGRFPLNSN